jgi:Protein of unknown function (DUF998)
MSVQTVSPAAQTTRSTVRLLAAGVVAGPLFLAVWLVQAMTRDGFDPTYHPLSLLSLGDLGWIQIASFVVTGALYLACAVGMRRALRGGPGATWGPLLIGIQGLGLIVAGVCVTDAAAGFPPGTPDGPPDHLTWHGVLHEVGYALTTLSWLAACVVYARRFAAQRRRVRVRACVAAPVAYLVLVAWPDLHSLSLRLVVATAVSFGLTAALAVYVSRDHSGTGG